jgi:hypothetical protein
VSKARCVYADAAVARGCAAGRHVAQISGPWRPTEGDPTLEFSPVPRRMLMHTQLKSNALVTLLVTLISAASISATMAQSAISPGSTPLETIQVPADGTPVTSQTVLESDVTYQLRASGTVPIGFLTQADAEWQVIGPPFNIVGSTCGTIPDVDIGIGIDDTVNSPAKFPSWGPFNATRIYTVDFVGTGSAITLNFHDCFYFDNSGSLTVEIIRPCPAKDPITDAEAQRFEDYAASHGGDPPPESLLPPEAVDATFSQKVADLELLVGGALQRKSGFRPQAYQKHLLDLRTKWSQLTALNPFPSECSSALTDLNHEIDDIHGLNRGPHGEPVVGSLMSRHTSPPVLAMDLGPRSEVQALAAAVPSLDFLAGQVGLSRPCLHIKDIVHFQPNGTDCSLPSGTQPLSLRWIVESPVNVLVTDPLGRRIGFDPNAGVTINEIGPTASYTGIASHPQAIDIDDPIVGNYVLTGIGIAGGPYRITYRAITQDSEVAESRSVQGVASPGQAITPEISTVRSSVVIDIKPGSSPNSINTRSEGSIPVAILSTAEIMAPNEIDSSSLTFGRTGEELHGPRCNPEDVTGDGLPDLVCHFRNGAGAFQEGDTEGVLKGSTVTGRPFVGRDAVRVVQ